MCRPCLGANRSITGSIARFPGSMTGSAASLLDQWLNDRLGRWLDSLLIHWLNCVADSITRFSDPLKFRSFLWRWHTGWPTGCGDLCSVPLNVWQVYLALSGTPSELTPFEAVFASPARLPSLPCRGCLRSPCAAAFASLLASFDPTYLSSVETSSIHTYATGVYAYIYTH